MATSNATVQDQKKWVHRLLQDHSRPEATEVLPSEPRATIGKGTSYPPFLPGELRFKNSQSSNKSEAVQSLEEEQVSEDLSMLVYCLSLTCAYLHPPFLFSAPKGMLEMRVLMVKSAERLASCLPQAY